MEAAPHELVHREYLLAGERNARESVGTGERDLRENIPAGEREGGESNESERCHHN